jgi:hypothetical protein
MGPATPGEGRAEGEGSFAAFHSDRPSTTSCPVPRRRTPAPPAPRYLPRGAPIEAGAIMVLLGTLVGRYCLPGVCILLFVVPAQVSARPQTRWAPGTRFPPAPEPAMCLPSDRACAGRG